MEDKYLLGPKALYFFLNMAVYSTYSYLPNYLRHKWKISLSAYGFFTSTALLSFFGSILWTKLADRTGQHKNILIFSTIGFMIAFMTFSTPLITLFSDTWKVIITGTIIAVSDIFISCLYPLLDNRIFLYLESKGSQKKTLYGRQRLFGTLGQGVISALNGFLIKLIDYKIVFISLVICGIIYLLLILYVIPNNAEAIQENNENSQNKNEETRGKHEAVKFTFSLSCFFLGSLFTGITRSILGSYLTSFFEYDLKMKSDSFGIAMQTRIFSEVLFYFIGPNLSKLMGNHAVFFLGQTLGILRPIFYLLPSKKSDKWPIIILLVELLKGAGNACLITSGVKIVYDLNPRLAYAQGLFSGIHINLATAMAGAIGGIMLKGHDENIRELFYISIILGIIGFILHFVSVSTKKKPLIDG